MGIETARRVRDQVREGLAELIRLVNDPSTPTADVRDVLSESKALGAQVSVLQADAAVVVAARERHGDSGVGVLAQAAGLSRRDAAGQVQTAQRLQSMPAVRDAVQAGQISVANAKTLARASGKTSASQVDGDAELLTKAAEMSPEQFAKEAGRWAVKRQDDGGEGEYRRQRARRRLSIWDGDDGMVHLRGELDPVTGAKVRKRFLLEAERLRRADLHSPGGEKRSLNQRMADALDTLTEHGSIYSKAGSATPSGHDRGGTGAATNASRGVSESDRGSNEGLGGVGQKGKGGDASQASGGVGSASGGVGSASGGVGSASGGVGSASGGMGSASGGMGSARGDVGPAGSASLSHAGAGGMSRASGGVSDMTETANGGRARDNGNGSDVSGTSSGTGGGGRCGCGGRPSADITIVQHLSADGTDTFAEIAGGGVIPASVLEEYFCNARIKGVVFSHEGLPLWHSHAKRLATKAQMSALRALYGACGGCGADMCVCQGHHIRPVSQGGPTNIDNMMLLCWACHQKVHHHGWRVVPDGRGLRTIAPPERIRYGPAHAPDPAPAQGPPPPRNTARQPGAGSIARAAPDRVNLAEARQPEPLFTLA